MKKNFIINFVIWKKKYVDETFKYCLSSMCSKNNIPKIHSNFCIYIGISTFKGDKNYIEKKFKKHPISKYSKLLIFEIENESSNQSKYDILAAGHLLAANFSFKTRSILSFMPSDCVISDGLFLEIYKYSKKGFDLITLPALRHEKNDFFKFFKFSNYSNSEKIIDVSSEVLSDLALKSFHITIKRTFYDSNEFNIHIGGLPSILCFKNIDHNIVLTYAQSFVPMYVDYSKIVIHKNKYLKLAPIDGPYLGKNFSHLRVKSLESSLQGILTSWTDDKDLKQITLFHKTFKSLNIFNFFKKLIIIHSYVFNKDKIKNIVGKNDYIIHTKFLSKSEINYIQETKAFFNSTLRLAKSFHIRIIAKIIICLYKFTKELTFLKSRFKSLFLIFFNIIKGNFSYLRLILSRVKLVWYKLFYY